MRERERDELEGERGGGGLIGEVGGHQSELESASHGAGW